MNRFSKNSVGVYNAISNVLETESRQFTEEELVNRVASMTGYKPSNGTLSAVVRSRVLSGTDEGMVRQGRATRISFKQKIEVSADTAKLQNQISELSATLQESQTSLQETEAKLEKAKKETGGVVRVDLTKVTGETKVMKGLFHDKFQRILKLAEARMNVFLYGPTGCGKSHICSQVAKALDLPFAFVSCTAGMSEGVLGGRLLPLGDAGKFEYAESDFIRLYENGGVFLLDEMDAADPNVLLLVNAALANGEISLPNRPEKPVAKRHADFICIAAANTVGGGADRMYSGRNKLDAATMDRFQIGKVKMDYDARVEAILCPDEELRTKLETYREAINLHRMERAMSTRFMKDAYKMSNDFGWDQEDIDAAYFEGWREDEIVKVKNHRS